MINGLTKVLRSDVLDLFLLEGSATQDLVTHQRVVDLDQL